MAKNRNMKKGTKKKSKKGKVALIVVAAVGGVMLLNAATFVFSQCLSFGLENIHSLDEESVVIVDPTCTEDGYIKGTCIFCGDEIVEPIEKLGHEAGEEVIEFVDSTCSEEGHETHECTRCGEEIVEVVEKKPHNEVVIAGVPSTCMNPGMTPGRMCGDCGEYLLEPINTGLKPHTEVEVEGYDATCDAPGYTDGTACADCGTPIVAQEEIPAIGHDLDGIECTRCNYADLGEMFPDGYEYVDLTSTMYLTGKVFKLDSSNEGRQLYVSLFHEDVGSGPATMLYVYLDRLESSGQPYQLEGVKFFEYEGEHYVRFPTKSENSFVNSIILDTNYSAKHVKAITYDKNYTLWNVPESEDMFIENGVLNFNGTGIVCLSTKDKYDNFEITFTVDEVSDVRGAFQFGIGAESTDTEIMRTTYVQFNYDRPVVVLPDGTTHNYWTNGNEWTVRVENGLLTLSCENGVICEDLDIGAGTGHLILRAESSCALSIHNLKIVEL